MAAKRLTDREMAQTRRAMSKRGLSGGIYNSRNFSKSRTGSKRSSKR